MTTDTEPQDNEPVQPAPDFTWESVRPDGSTEYYGFDREPIAGCLTVNFGGDRVVVDIPNTLEDIQALYEILEVHLIHRRRAESQPGERPGEA